MMKKEVPASKKGGRGDANPFGKWWGEGRKRSALRTAFIRKGSSGSSRAGRHWGAGEMGRDRRNPANMRMVRGQVGPRAGNLVSASDNWRRVVRIERKSRGVPKKGLRFE